MAHIVLPASAAEQGHAFEDLILSHYQKSGRYSVLEWSSYLHGRSGRWWQCDGIVQDNRGRYLVEAKFFSDRPATVRDVNPARRESAARDLECTGIQYISLNGFAPDLLSWSPHAHLDVQFLTWADLRGEVLTGLSGYASVLLDEFDLTDVCAYDASSGVKLRFDAAVITPLSSHLAEFVTVRDGLERWLRRMPRLSLHRAQIAAGQFWYDSPSGQVALVPDRASDLCLQEAWAIQDAISGYASRTYRAVRATAQALAQADGGLIADVQAVLRQMGWKTGVSGVRNSLDFMVQLGLAHKWLDSRRSRYALLPWGRAYALGGPDDALFQAVLERWLPYQAVCKAILEHGVPVAADDILNYFQRQYAPYQPYARSLFNPNKADGLIHLYKRFGS